MIGVRRDGRLRYDPQAKNALVEAALQPGVSLAGLALKHGVNANLLRKWVVRRQRACSPAVSASCVSAPAQAFVPVVEVACAEATVDEPALPVPAALPASPARPALARLKAHLPNGVVLELACGEQDAGLVSAVIDSLGRCDVSPGR